MRQSWSDLKFPELYIAAICLYDHGYRKESIYWFYTAQYQGRLVGSVLDRKKFHNLGDPAVELLHVHEAFQDLVGPYIYGYAFEDVDNYLATIERIRKESETIPDLAKLYPDVNLKQPSDWPKSNHKVQHGLDELVALIKKQRTTFDKVRADKGIDTKFAGLSNKDLPK